MNTLTQYGVRTCVWLQIKIPQLDSHLSSLYLSAPFFPPLYLHFSLSQQTTQVELVLLIFRRLTEDIHTFPEGLAPPRRREMVAALTADVETVFAFLLQNLEV